MMNEGGDDVEDDEVADDEDNDVDRSFPFAKRCAHLLWDIF